MGMGKAMKRLAAILVLALPRGAWAETVVIGAEDDWYPYSGLVDKKVQGITIDLVRAAFEAAGVDMRYEIMPYARCMALTKAGQLTGCFDTLRHPGIEHDYLWHEQPMFAVQYQIYARTGSDERGLRPKDLEGQNVAVTRSYEYGPEFDTNQKIVRLFSRNDESNFRMLLAGRVRYTVAMEWNTLELIKRRPEFEGQFQIVGAVAESGVYTVFSKYHPQGPKAMKHFNEGMAKLRKSGRYQAILDDWRARLAGDVPACASNPMLRPVLSDEAKTPATHCP
ncbi:MAG: transporter substrate-binding domain-containing protein [Gammaproteobacteria bacterium]|nr:transporter substrate-binding domain-containing protein [Gammaproteobacteria bacterium]